MESYVVGKQLISQEEWSMYLQGLKATTQETTQSYTIPLAQALEQAILQRAQHIQKQKRTIGLLLSGGVDSAVIAHVLHNNNLPFIAYTIAFHTGNIDQAKDLAFAKKLTQELGVEHKTKTYTLEEIEQLFIITANVLQEQTATLSLGVGAVEIASIQLAKQDSVADLFGGLGSEDIFAGYRSYLEADDINECCWDGLQKMWSRDLKRDTTIAQAYNVSLPTPFLDEEVIRLAMSIAGSEKIKEHKTILQKKYCLRKAAEHLGLTDEYVWRPKLAAQYGSKMDTALERVAKEKNLTKQEYVATLKNK